VVSTPAYKILQVSLLAVSDTLRVFENTAKNLSAPFTIAIFCRGFRLLTIGLGILLFKIGGPYLIRILGGPKVCHLKNSY